MKVKKTRTMKPIPHSNTLEELKNDEKDKGILIFKYMRPLLIKLLFHLILIFLSIRAYTNFLQSSTVYENFKQTLNEKVVLDIKLQDYDSQCDSGYEDIEFTYFPQILRGCRCNFDIFPDNLCQSFKEYNFTGADLAKSKTTCKIIDKNLNNTISQQQAGPSQNLPNFRYLKLNENYEILRKNS